MKEVKIILLSLSLLLVFAVGAKVIYEFSGGRTFGVKKEIGPSERYTKREIREAMKVVEKKFKANFDGCILKTLEYEEDSSDESWAKEYRADRAMVLTSAFYVGKNAELGAFGPDNTYDGYVWVLTQNDGERWVLQTCWY